MLIRKENKEKYLILISIFQLDFALFKQMMEESSLQEVQKILHNQVITHTNSEMGH